MTEPVYVLGVGMTPVAEHWETSLRELAFQAMTRAMEDAGGIRPQALFVANALSPILSGQAHLGALLSDFAGFSGIEAVTVEAAGASGGLALRQACLGLQAGAFESALVLGVEKVTDRVGTGLDSALASSSDSDYEAIHGLTGTSQAALIMRRYLHEYGAPADALAGFSLIAHANAVGNPNAMFRRAITLEDYGRAGMVSDPINLYDAAPLADGAAAIVLARASVARLPDRVPVQVLGTAGATARLAVHDLADPLTLSAAAASARRALERAGLSPDRIDLFEVHELFQHLRRSGAGGRRVRLPGRGMAVCQERSDLPGGKAAPSDFRWLESQRRGRGRDRRLPGGRGGAPAPGPRRSQPGRECPMRDGPVPGWGWRHGGDDGTRG